MKPNNLYYFIISSLFTLTVYANPNCPHRDAPHSGEFHHHAEHQAKTRTTYFLKKFSSQFELSEPGGENIEIYSTYESKMIHYFMNVKETEPTIDAVSNFK